MNPLNGNCLDRLNIWSRLSWLKSSVPRLIYHLQRPINFAPKQNHHRPAQHSSKAAERRMRHVPYPRRIWMRPIVERVTFWRQQRRNRTCTVNSGAIHLNWKWNDAADWFQIGGKSQSADSTLVSSASFLTFLFPNNQTSMSFDARWNLQDVPVALLMIQFGHCS